MHDIQSSLVSLQQSYTFYCCAIVSTVNVIYIFFYFSFILICLFLSHFGAFVSLLFFILLFFNFLILVLQLVAMVISNLHLV